MRRTLGTLALVLFSLGLVTCGRPIVSESPAPAATPNKNSVVYQGTDKPKSSAPAKATLPLPSPITIYVGPKSATVTLEDGRSFSFSLRGDAAPKTVENFVNKARAGAYNGLTFHRVEDWVVQGGDPKGNGTGGGSMTAEYNQLPFTVGSVGIARGADRAINNDMQFFVVKKASDFLNGNYTNFGQITSGIEVINTITVGTKIKTVTVQ